jgi:hypothetical protein
MTTQNELLDRMIKDNQWWLPGWSKYPDPPYLTRGSQDHDLLEFCETFKCGGICPSFLSRGLMEYPNVWLVLHHDLYPILVLLYDKLYVEDPFGRIDYVIWTMEALECFNEGGEYGSTKPKSVKRRRKGLGL